MQSILPCGSHGWSGAAVGALAMLSSHIQLAPHSHHVPAICAPQTVEGVLTPSVKAYICGSAHTRLNIDTDCDAIKVSCQLDSAQGLSGTLLCMCLIVITR